MPVTIDEVMVEPAEAPPATPAQTQPTRQPPPDMEAIAVALRRDQSRRERLWVD